MGASDGVLHHDGAENAPSRHAGHILVHIGQVRVMSSRLVHVLHWLDRHLKQLPKGGN